MLKIAVAALDDILRNACQDDQSCEVKNNLRRHAAPARDCVKFMVQQFSPRPAICCTEGAMAFRMFAVCKRTSSSAPYKL